MSRRILDHPILGRRGVELVEIIVDGATINAHKGEPIAAAMLAAGIEVFRFSYKRQDPRGIFCGIGRCSDCVVLVTGKGYVRSCVEPVVQGMEISTNTSLPLEE